VVVGRERVRVFTLPSEAGEAQVLNRTAESASTHDENTLPVPTEILAISCQKVTIMALKNSGDVQRPLFIVTVQDSFKFSSGQLSVLPCFRLCARASGRRAMWLTHQMTDRVQSPRFECATLSGSKESVTNFTGDPNLLPSLWAFTQFDFDDALGLMVVGNVFGELAFCDFVDMPTTVLCEDFPTWEGGPCTRIANVGVLNLL
jgi:hypothetical protein